MYVYIVRLIHLSTKRTISVLTFNGTLQTKAIRKFKPLYMHFVKNTCIFSKVILQIHIYIIYIALADGVNQDNNILIFSEL